MFSHEAFDFHGRTLPGTDGPLRIAGDRRLRLPRVEQGQTADWNYQTSLSARRETQNPLGTIQNLADPWLSGSFFPAPHSALKMGLFDKFKAGLQKTHSRL